MLYWYLKIKDLKIPQPKTEILEVENLALWDFPIKELNKWPPKIEKIADRLGYPLFIRTDQASGKHTWKHSCFVPNKESLKRCIEGVLEFNYCATPIGLPCEALVFREYIPMKNLFTAFCDMPVNPEIRFFVKDGELLCWHWYWIEEAIKNPSVHDWKEIMDKEKKELSGNELLWLERDARKVANQFEGYWSVDFCKAKDGRWILIDLAEGEKSWHPDCEAKEEL